MYDTWTLNYDSRSTSLRLLKRSSNSSELEGKVSEQDADNMHRGSIYNHAHLQTAGLKKTTPWRWALQPTQNHLQTLQPLNSCPHAPEHCLVLACESNCHHSSWRSQGRWCHTRVPPALSCPTLPAVSALEGTLAAPG